MNQKPDSEIRIPLWILIPALALPGLATWIYWSDIVPEWQGIIYGLMKVLYIVLPIVCLLFIEKDRFEPLRWDRAAVICGCLTGLAILACIWGGFFFVGRGLSAIADAPQSIAGKLAGFGIDTPLEYAGLTLFATVLNSSMEEFYWRWFLFGRLRRWIPWTAAALVSSIGFSLHHFIILSRYIESWPLTLMVTAFVGLGGFIWCVNYHFTRNMLSAWISHACADIGVFAIGFLLLRQVW